VRFAAAYQFAAKPCRAKATLTIHFISTALRIFAVPALSPQSSAFAMLFRANNATAHHIVTMPMQFPALP